jgi:hypothetical protein
MQEFYVSIIIILFICYNFRIIEIKFENINGVYTFYIIN